MLIIQGMHMAYRQAGLFEGILQSTTQVKITLNQNTKVQSSKVLIKNKASDWSKNDIPKMKLADPTKPAQVQFQFYRNDEKIGSAKSSLQPGYPRKDCLDVIGSKFQFVGKFIYQAYWEWGKNGIEPKKQNLDPNQSNFYGPYSGSNLSNDNPYQMGSVKMKSKQKYSGCGLFSCLSPKVMRKIPTLPTKKVYIYQQNQLKALGVVKRQTVKSTFYSAKCYQCN